MADKQFSDTTVESLGLTTKLLSEDNSITNKFSHVTGQKVIDLLVAQGYLTQTEIEALSSLIKVSDFSNDSIVQKNGSGTIVSTLISELITAYPKLLKKGFSYTATTNLIVGEGRFYNEHFAGLTKTFGIFAKGTGSGCLNSSAIVYDRKYFVYLIKETSTGDYDIFADVKADGTNIPTGWTEEFIFGSFNTDASSIVQSSIIQSDEYFTFGENGKPLPIDYVNNFTLTYYNTLRFIISPCWTRDESDTWNMKYYSDYNYSFTALTASTRYYIFQTYNSYTVSYDIDTSSTGAGITTTYKRLIGTFITDSSGLLQEDYLIEWRNIDNRKIIGQFALGNYSRFFNDGTLRYRGNATTWDDMVFPMSAYRLDSTAGKLQYNYTNNSITMQSGGTLGTAADTLIFTFQKLHKIKKSSHFKLHMHFEQPTGDKFEFDVQYRIEKNGNAKTSTWSTPVTVDTKNDAVYTYTSGTLIQIINIIDVDMSTMSISDILEVQFARSDSFSGSDIEAISIDAHVEMDSEGSEEEWVKNN